MTCFLIDDDLDDQEFFNLALENIDSSIKCLVADDASHALQILTENKELVPDLIFIDMRMPKMNGSDCVREFKKIDRLKKVPTILYSTSDGEIGNGEAKRAGADHFFTKATSIPELSKILEEIIDKFRKTA